MDETIEDKSDIDFFKALIIPNIDNTFKEIIIGENNLSYLFKIFKLIYEENLKDFNFGEKSNKKRVFDLYKKKFYKEGSRSCNMDIYTIVYNMHFDKYIPLFIAEQTLQKKVIKLVSKIFNYNVDSIDLNISILKKGGIRYKIIAIAIYKILLKLNKNNLTLNDKLYILFITKYILNNVYNDDYIYKDDINYYIDTITCFNSKHDKIYDNLDSDVRQVVRPEHSEAVLAADEPGPAAYNDNTGIAPAEPAPAEPRVRRVRRTRPEPVPVPVLVADEPGPADDDDLNTGVSRADAPARLADSEPPAADARLAAFNAYNKVIAEVYTAAQEKVEYAAEQAYNVGEIFSSVTKSDVTAATAATAEPYIEIAFRESENAKTTLNTADSNIDEAFSLYNEASALNKENLSKIIDIYNSSIAKSKAAEGYIANAVIHAENSIAASTSAKNILGHSSGGYNNKSGNIDYHICKANFKQTFKKVSAKSSREAAKMVAMKVLKDKKKSAKFSLKRMIGKKEKCYDYDVSIDKSGKIIIKNQ